MYTASPLAGEDETTRKLLDDLWQRLLPQTAERLHLLDQAAAAVATRTLTPALQAEAAATAHKLAGSLGMFGFHQGSVLARKLEEHLGSLTPNPPALATLIHELRRSLADPPASSPRNPPAAGD